MKLKLTINIDDPSEEDPQEIMNRYTAIIDEALDNALKEEAVDYLLTCEEVSDEPTSPAKPE
jgi:hypothetical protein